MECSSSGDLARVDSSITIARCSADGNTPLLRAAALKNVRAAEALMASCANPNDANYQGGTGLHVAAEFGHLDTTFALLRRDASPNTQDARPRLDASS